MLVVVSKSLEIPHVINLGGKDYTFDPMCDVPDDLAKKITANKPDIFSVAPDSGVVDVSEYRVKDVFQGKSVEEIFKMLPEKERIEVYALLKKKAKAVQKRELEKKKEELAAISSKDPDKVAVALGLENVSAEDLAKATGEGKKGPEIKKVR